jgi:hypothetical protein
VIGSWNPEKRCNGIVLQKSNKETWKNKIKTKLKLNRNNNKKK